ncbi:hypothetical protein [Asticcacaulis sp. 201]|uniref:hypothetical protein n=1 Tax=Asticcacaulis sp. 201 TaxID=3028787 RepID=UPI002916249C|nr:hypothetical protein [Asticcacaulis sp. 201]MDV6331143.1 hypothetical protein [Asticcacaulis sp. 201]
MKYIGGESDLIERRPVLDKLIAEALNQKAGSPSQIDVGRDSIERADWLLSNLY